MLNRCLGLENLKASNDDIYLTFQFDWLDGKEECLIYFENNMNLIRKNDPNIYEDCIKFLRKNKLKRLLNFNI